jgi:hypothetical protein
MASGTNGFYNLSYINDCNTFTSHLNGNISFTSGTITYSQMNSSSVNAQITLSFPITTEGCFYLYFLRPTGQSNTSSNFTNYSRYGFGYRPAGGNTTPIGTNSGQTSFIQVTLSTNGLRVYKATSWIPSNQDYVYALWCFSDNINTV